MSDTKQNVPTPAKHNANITGAAADLNAAFDAFLARVKPKIREAANYAEHNQAFDALINKISLLRSEVKSHTEKMKQPVTA